MTDAPLILLVDDNPMTRRSLAATLRTEGFRVTEASDAASAIAEARRMPPTVVLQDLLLPDMDGLELTARLRGIPGLEEVPILALFGFLSRLDAARLTSAGVTGYMVKPIAPDRLIQAIHGFLVARASSSAGGIDDLSLDDHDPVRLLRRTWFQAAQLSVLGGVAEALARRDDPERAMQSVLAITLHAAGISRGAIFLKDSRGELCLRHAIGFPPDTRSDIEDFFGHWPILEEIVGGGMAITIPTPEVPEDVSTSILAAAQVATLEVVPLVSYGSGAGAILLGARRTDIASAEAVAFAQAVGAQIVQSLELTDTFARLAASEERYRSLFDNANDAIAVTTADGTVREVNRRMEEVLGLPREQIVGRHVSHSRSPGRKTSILSCQDLQPGAGHSLPFEIVRSGGDRQLIEISTTAVTLDGEELILFLGRDVTQEVQARAQLMVADRMVSVGTLAAGVAHEINNPLMAVTGNLEMAATDLEQMDDPSLPALDRVSAGIGIAREAANQIQKIVRDLKVFSRSDDEAPGPVDVNHVLDSSLRMARNEIRHRARLVRSYGDIPMVLGSESRLGQVFLNLLINAVQAIPEGAAEDHEIQVVTRCGAARDTVEVQVVDTGTGIVPAIRGKIFDPFFTTKEIGGGTGLGLSICHRIVSDLNGTLEVEPGVERGTIFRVTLPATTAKDSMPEPPAPPVHANRRILVIDDEPLVATVIARLLQKHHQVEVAAGGREALERIEAGERYDVLLCDLMMPSMTGMDLHAELARSVPDQAEGMIFMTGGAFSNGAQEFLSAVPNPRLEKPFDSASLLALIDGIPA